MSGSLHLFKFTGTLTSQDIKLNKNYLWHTLEIKWDKVKLTFNDNEVKLPQLIMISENATLKDSNNIELNLCHNCDQHECQDVILIKTKTFLFPNLSQITYPNDSCMVTQLWLTILFARHHSAHCICTVATVHLLHTSAWMVYHHLNNNISLSVWFIENYKWFFRTLYLETEKGKPPPVGFKPDASCLPDECPRLLGFG